MHLLEKLERRLIEQLDTLLPFLALAHEEVFELVACRYAEWLEPAQQGTLPNSFALFDKTRCG